jgi:hypothetical protein
MRCSGKGLLAVEWSAEGTAQYDVARLEQPDLAPSAEALRAREAASAPEPRFSLEQCLEVLPLFLKPRC